MTQAAVKANSRAITRQRFAAAALSAVAVLGLAGCRQDMHNQPKFYPQRGTSLYADGRSVRPQVENTVARGQNDATSYFMTGFQDGKEGDGMPIPVTLDVMERGQERYNVYCTACHSRVGNGGGIVVQRGYRPAGNFHTDRLRAAPLGHFYNVIANGYGAMPEYATMLGVEDRWAIVAYVRALQLSQNATVADAGGSPVRKLGDVAESVGLPRNFAAEWVLPATAVYGTPDNQDHGIPGQDQTVINKINSGAQGQSAQHTSGTAQGSVNNPGSPILPNPGSSMSPATLNGPR
ncbi:c-type cytochrome [Terriglobus sp.]|uniref:c-type cytochrome n=1 Tax=Terriglobus sp. TaxID=1889013 RepID=UPI003B00E0E3